MCMFSLKQQHLELYGRVKGVNEKILPVSYYYLSLFFSFFFFLSFFFSFVHHQPTADLFYQNRSQQRRISFLLSMLQIEEYRNVQSAKLSGGIY
jgi:hypothetical protein